MALINAEKELIKSYESEIKFFEERLEKKKKQLRDFRLSCGIKACLDCGRDISNQEKGDYCFICWDNG